MERAIRVVAGLAAAVCLGYIALRVYTITAAAVGSSSASDILATIARDLWPTLLALGATLTMWFLLQKGDEPGP